MEKAINKYKISYISIFGYKCAVEGDDLFFLYCNLPFPASKVKFYQNEDGNWKRIKYIQDIIIQK